MSWAWSDSKCDHATSRVRTRDALSESRMRDGLNSGTLNPHVRFDERDLETEHGRVSEAPATERAGNR